MRTEIIVRKDIPLGVWQGMGGAITEATAYNFSKLSAQKQQKFLNAYYGKNGLDYRWGRISIGSNDFCLEPYEYTKKTNLSDFSIEHDRQWVLPMLKEILQKKELKLLASPWSPPSCLKFPRRPHFGGNLKPWRYARYAQYIRKWLEAYAEEGIKIDYLSPQNEPFATQIWEYCTYSYRAQRKLAYKYLAKELDDSDVQLLLWDHNKEKLEEVANRLFKGKFVTRYGKKEKIAGLCYHWYDGTFPNEMWKVRQKYPDITIVSSEMCCYFSPYDEKEWTEAAKLYCYELFSDINCGASAWIDWNMLLSWKGGPNYCKNYTKSPVILNETEDDFILTPIFYFLKKIAKLFPAGSNIIRCDNCSKDIVAIARKVNAGYEVIVANISGKAQEVVIKLEDKEKHPTLSGFEIKRIQY